MELRQLRYFVRIVELGSVSRAAKALFIAQPALSAQIANLETELGVRLLTRSVRGVTATVAGESLYLHAHAVLRQIERLCHDVSTSGSTPGGPVSLGIPTSAANILAGPLIAAVQERYPDIQLRIVESLSGHLQEMVVNGRLEMSLLFEPGGTPSTSTLRDSTSVGHLNWLPLLDEELFLLSEPKNGVIESAPISLEEAAQLRLVLPGRSNITRQLIDQAFTTAGLQAHVVAEIDSLSTIQSIVESGHAATILSLSAFVGPDIRTKLSVRSLGGGTLSRRLSLCTSDIMGLGAAAESLVTLIPALVHAFVESGKWAGASIIQDESVGQL